MRSRLFSIILSLACIVVCVSDTFAQTPSSPPASSPSQVSPPSQASPPPPASSRKVPTLFDTMTVMPYLTVSLNIFSGQALPASATGVGAGGGIAFDLMKPGQKVGFLFDFAFQDMYGYAANGNFLSPLTTGDTGVIPSANAYHYWQYLLFEPFLKLQSNGKRNGYFLIGASFGFAVLSETVSIAPGYPYQYQQWDQTPWGNRFRIDIRAGVGVELGHIAHHTLMLEARAGYPITDEIAGYDGGNWRIITVQANLGLRL